MTTEIKHRGGRKSREYLALKAEIEANQLALETIITKRMELEAEIHNKKQVIDLLEKIIGSL